MPNIKTQLKEIGFPANLQPTQYEKMNWTGECAELYAHGNKIYLPDFFGDQKVYTIEETIHEANLSGEIFRCSAITLPDTDAEIMMVRYADGYYEAIHGNWGTYRRQHKVAGVALAQLLWALG